MEKFLADSIKSKTSYKLKRLQFLILQNAVTTGHSCRQTSPTFAAVLDQTEKSGKITLDANHRFHFFNNLG